MSVRDISLALRRVLVCSFVYSTGLNKRTHKNYIFFCFRALRVSLDLFSVLSESEQLKLSTDNQLSSKQFHDMPLYIKVRFISCKR